MTNRTELDTLLGAYETYVGMGNLKMAGRTLPKIIRTLVAVIDERPPEPEPEQKVHHVDQSASEPCAPCDVSVANNASLIEEFVAPVMSVDVVEANSNSHVSHAHGHDDHGHHDHEHEHEHDHEHHDHGHDREHHDHEHDDPHANSQTATSVAEHDADHTRQATRVPQDEEINAIENAGYSKAPAAPDAPNDLIEEAPVEEPVAPAPKTPKKPKTS